MPLASLWIFHPINYIVHLPCSPKLTKLHVRLIYNKQVYFRNILHAMDSRLSCTLCTLIINHSKKLSRFRILPLQMEANSVSIQRNSMLYVYMIQPQGLENFNHMANRTGLVSHIYVYFQNFQSFQKHSKLSMLSKAFKAFKAFKSIQSFQSFQSSVY